MVVHFEFIAADSFLVNYTWMGTSNSVGTYVVKIIIKSIVLLVYE